MTRPVVLNIVWVGFASLRMWYATRQRARAIRRAAARLYRRRWMS